MRGGEFASNYWGDMFATVELAGGGERKAAAETRLDPSNVLDAHDADRM